MSKYTKNLNNTKVNYPIRFNLPNNTKSPVFYSAQEAQQWFNTNYGDKYSIQMPDISTNATQNTSTTKNVATQPVKLPEITVEAPKTNYRVNLDMLGINPFNWPKYIPESYWDSDTHKAIKEGNNITACIVTAPILGAAASKVLPYMSAKGILAATNAAGITPGWFTPTVASVIDTSIAGTGLGLSLNDIRKNGPTFGNVLGTGLSALGFAGEIPGFTQAVKTIYNNRTLWDRFVHYGTPYVQHVPKPLSIREKLGLSKGVYGSLNKYQKQALEDYEQYQTSGKLRNKFVYDTTDGSFKYTYNVESTKQIPAVRYITSLPNSKVTSDFVRTPTQELAYFPNINQSRIAFLPKGYNFGELRATPEQNGFQKSIVLTSPRVDFIDAMVGGTPEQIAKLPNRIPKEDMKRFWESMEQTTKPGTYLSGDAGRMPLGGFMIKAKTPSEASKILLTDAADISSVGTRMGLSPDSYKAIVKQGLRPGHRLRFSRNSFTKLNSSAVDNKALYEQWKAANTPELKKKFVEDWNNQIYPNSAFIDDSGTIRFLQPFVYYMQKGGTITG